MTAIASDLAKTPSASRDTLDLLRRLAYVIEYVHIDYATPHSYNDEHLTPLTVHFRQLYYVWYHRIRPEFWPESIPWCLEKWPVAQFAGRK